VTSLQSSPNRSRRKSDRESSKDSTQPQRKPCGRERGDARQFFSSQSQVAPSVFFHFLLCSPVTEQFGAFLSEKTASDRDAVIALLEYEPAGDEASSPLVVFRAALAAIRGNVFLGDAVDDRANSSPHLGAGAHGAGLVRRVEHEVGQVPTITA
jgi:hypothetical protein